MSSQELYHQYIDSLAMNFAESLIEDKSINEVLIYVNGCYGCDVIEECSCYEGPIEFFVMWKNNNKTFLKLFKCCSESDIYEVGLVNQIDNIVKNRNEIFGSKFKFNVETSHYLFYELKLITGKTNQYIKMFDYMFDEINSSHRQNSMQPARRFQVRLNSKIRELDIWENDND